MKINLNKKTEVWSYEYDGTLYEIHVDATEERIITNVFCENNNEISTEVINHLKNIISKIN